MTLIEGLFQIGNMEIFSTKNWRQVFFALLIILTHAGITHAQSAQWHGPNRDGTYPDTSLQSQWPEDGPAKRFVTKDIGKGYSSAVATKDFIYVTGIKDTIEYLTALDHSGKTV